LETLARKHGWGIGFNHHPHFPRYSKLSYVVFKRLFLLSVEIKLSIMVPLLVAWESAT